MSCLLQLLLMLRKPSQHLGRIGTVIACLWLTGTQVARAEGSSTLYPSGAIGNRANLEWRSDALYGGVLTRRTLLKVYANAGENILLGSSAVGVGVGDIRVFNPGRVAGAIGSEIVPSTADFQCSTQRTTLGNSARGRITSRTLELAGPQSISGTGNTSGYVPCYYTAPTTGIYDVVFIGPDTRERQHPGAIDHPDNFTSVQGNSVAAWDVTVRSSNLDSTQNFTGRLFTYYFALFAAGDNGRPLYFPIYPVTNDGYQYKITLRGLDPNGFVLYGNQVGFFDSDGKTPLYHDLLGQDENLRSPDGGASLARPQFATFVNPPDPTVLQAINVYDVNGNFSRVGIPIVPVPPSVNSLNFTGTVTGNTSIINQGGAFTFNSSIAGNYQLVISRDGSNFDPTNPQNRVLRGVMTTSGAQSVMWDGRDNDGNAFPVGSYPSRVQVHAGEYHFPLIDAENNFEGGPTIELLNATNPIRPGSDSNFVAFYDDRGYRSNNGTIVGTVGQVLCGNGSPSPTSSDPIIGFDSRTNDRKYGRTTGGNTNSRCSGSFGDTKGLDIWTYFPSNASLTTVNIINNSSANLRLVKRITALNNTPYSEVINDFTDPNDDNSINWQAGYLQGRTGKRITANDVITVRPGNQLEYTVYFLSDGNATAQNITLCDLIPPNTTFIENTYNSSNPKDGITTGTFGIRLSIGNNNFHPTNANDADRGQYFAPGTLAPCGANGSLITVPNGAITVRLSSITNATAPGTPTNSFGFIRFRVRVN